MAVNDITKKINIIVDSKQLKDYLKNLSDTYKIEREIAELNKNTSKSRKEFLEKEIDRLSKLNDEEIKRLKTSKTGIEYQKASYSIELSRLKLEDQLIKKQQERAKIEKQAQYNDQKSSFKKAREDFELSAQKRQLEKGPRDTARLAGQIKNWGSGGAFEFLADLSQEKGEKAVEGFDKDIFNKQQDIAERKQSIDNLLKAKENPNLSADMQKRIDSRIVELQQQNTQSEEDIKGLELKKSETIGKTKGEVSKYQAMASAAQQVAGQLKKIGSKIAGTLLKPFNDLKDAVLGNVKAMLDLRTGIATFSTSTSLITNATAREQQLKYGLNSSQNYAFTQAKSMLGIQSDEDLMYMNKEQRDRLLQYMDKYSRWYEEMEASGVLQGIQEMQLEFEELKQEISMEFLSWVAENKETIMACIRGIFEVVKFVANLIMSIVNFITGGKANNYDLYNGATASDNINNNNTNNSRISNITINANTTNNATGVLGSQDALDEFNKDNWSKLAKQVVTAIGG